jgi:hypothetical protein
MLIFLVFLFIIVPRRLLLQSMVKVLRRPKHFCEDANKRCYEDCLFEHILAQVSQRSYTVGLLSYRLNCSLCVCFHGEGKMDYMCDSCRTRVAYHRVEWKVKALTSAPRHPQFDMLTIPRQVMNLRLSPPSHVASVERVMRTLSWTVSHMFELRSRGLPASMSG